MTNHIKKTLTLLIKPASGQCNLRCKYCFYHDVVENRDVKNYGMMGEDTLDQLIKKAYEYANGMVSICFQGGEPMLRGFDFYHRVIECVEKHNTKHIPTSYSIQTNGTLIDIDWAKFFKANRFLVGISLDGYKDTHDLNRITVAGKGTFNQIQQAIQMLNKFDVDFNILCVVTSHIAQHPAKVYRFFKKQNIEYMQFIPCMDRLGQPMGRENYSLSPELYGRFLVTLFNEWFEDLMNGEYISIRMFDNIVNMLNGKQPEACDMQGVCSRGTVIEADGSVYPCDFYVMDEWKAGNVHSDDFESMIQSETMDRFVEISKHIDPACRECSYFSICRSGCRRYKEPIEDGKPLVNYFCESYKMFYSACLARLYQAARAVRR